MESINKGFELLIDNQKKEIVIAIYNIELYKKMSKKKLYDETGASKDKYKDPEDLRNYLIQKEKMDIKKAQKAIKRLLNLKKKYGETEWKTDFDKNL